MNTAGDTTNPLYTKATELYGRLLLPPCRLDLRLSTATRPLEVYDPLRRAWVALSPEEWVRQHFVAYMCDALGYSPLRMANEVPLVFNSMSRRADTVVYDDSLRPLLVVEYKAPTIKLTTETLKQAMRYNQVFGAKAIMVTNGMDVYSLSGSRLFRGVVSRDML